MGFLKTRICYISVREMSIPLFTKQSNEDFCVTQDRVDCLLEYIAGVCVKSTHTYETFEIT